MKKKQSFPRQFTDEKWQKYFGIVCILGLMLIGIVTAVNTFQNRSSVSAHPAQKITIGKNDGVTNTEFELPFDAIDLKEKALTDAAPLFDDYVQSDILVPIMEKGTVRAYGSPAASNGTRLHCNIMDVEVTDNGNYFVLFQLVGSGTAGIVRTAVYNKSGEQLAVNNYGTRENLDFRVNSKMLNKSGNDFLVTVYSNRYLKYTVTESGNTATIDRTLFTKSEVQGNPNTMLRTDYSQIIDQFSGYSNDALMIGRSGYAGPTTGTYKKRMAVGAINTSGWLSSGFNANANYQYTLQTLLITEDLNLSEEFSPTQYGNRNPGAIFKRNGYTFGQISYSTNTQMDGSGNSIVVNTFQIFSNEDIADTEVSDNGIDNRPKVVKKRVYQHRDNQTIHNDAITAKNWTYEVVKNLCTDNLVYFFAKSVDGNQLIRVNLTTLTEEIVKTYPANSSLNFYPDGKGNYAFYGSTDRLTGELYSDYYTNQLNSPYYFISGIMNGITGSATDLDVKSLRAFGVAGLITPTFAFEGESDEIFMAGQTRDFNVFPTYKYLIDENEPDYTVEGGTPSAYSAFVGTLVIKDDYSPAVDHSKDITVNITDNKIANPTSSGYRGWNTLDRWLITGRENGGLMTHDTAIKVYDHFDSNDPLIGSSVAAREEWLEKRINRNPRDQSAEIEWEKLGFNKTKSGPQLVTYFVTDSQSQVSNTSRWINKKTSQTIVDQDNKFALDAQNFHVALDGINTKIPDADTFKRMAKTTAWDLVNHGTNGDYGGGLDEDGEENKLSGKVTVDANQLQALRDATVAKPYPVDVTYDTGVSGIVIKNRVWVFVTTKNTIPNTETKPNAITPKDTNGVVYYADDYSIPYRLRKNETNGTVLTTGNVKVYDYFDASNETSAELPTLADATKNANKLVVHLPTIHDALAPGKVTPSVTYKWDGAVDANHKDGTVAGNETVGYLDIDLTADALFHVRQVVLDASGEIVVPTEGYFDFKNVMYNAGSPAVDPNYQVNLTGKSDTLTANPAFTTAAVATDKLADLNDQLKLSVIVPEFYQYLGYYYTTDNGSSHAANTAYTAGPLQINKADLNNKGEFWVTMYLKPNVDDQNNTKTPQPYSWDYEKNDLGKIKP